MRQLTFGREMTSIDEISLFSEPSQPIGQPPKEGAVLCVLPAQQGRDLR
jgi:hypothetical protein